MAVYKDEKELMSTDWQGKINEAVAAGDYSAAAQYEQARNDKINSSSYTGKQTTTNNYSSYLSSGSSGGSSGGSSSGSSVDPWTQYAGTDYHQDAIDAAINQDWEGVYAALANRADKIAAQGGDDRGKSNEQILADLIAQYGQKQQVKLPEYNSQQSSQIDSLLNSILNREPFSYDHTTDPTYLAYEDKYRRLGDRAREDTLGDIAALNGGYASSWATTAASQAQNDYNQQLSDVIPTLYDAAYNRYLNEDSLMRSDLGLVMDVDNMYYDRYRDTVADSQWQQQFDYTKEQDNIANNQWQQSFDWNKTVDQWNMDNTEAAQKFDQLMSKWQLTGVADAEVAAELGVPVGTTTESYYFNKLASQLDQAKLSLQQQEASKKDDANIQLEESIARNAKERVNATESYQAGAEYILSAVSSADEYYRVGSKAGIPTSVLQQVFDSFYDQALKFGDEEVAEPDYAYYAALMGQQTDPEAWLIANKYSIPSDILEDLYKLLDY